MKAFTLREAMVLAFSSDFAPHNLLLIPLFSYFFFCGDYNRRRLCGAKLGRNQKSYRHSQCERFLVAPPTSGYSEHLFKTQHFLRKMADLRLRRQLVREQVICRGGFSLHIPLIEVNMSIPSNIRNKVAVGAELFEKVIDGNHQVDTTVSTISLAARLTRGIEIVAYETNTEPVYVSRRSNVTADEAATGGFRLVPGASVFFPALATSEIFFISTVATSIGYLGY